MGRDYLCLLSVRGGSSDSGLVKNADLRHPKAQTEMITAKVNDMGIVLTFDSPADNLTPDGWDSVLDELKSQYIPSFYQYGKRLHVDVSPEGKHRAVIYLTPQTVTIDDAIGILRKRNINVVDLREGPEQ
jgi:hypothetical protein